MCRFCDSPIAGHGALPLLNAALCICHVSGLCGRSHGRALSSAGPCRHRPNDAEGRHHGWAQAAPAVAPKVAYAAFGPSRAGPSRHTRAVRLAETHPQTACADSRHQSDESAAVPSAHCCDRPARKNYRVMTRRSLQSRRRRGPATAREALSEGRFARALRHKRCVD